MAQRLKAAEYDFTIEQGAEWDRVVKWLDSDGNPVNLTGYTAKLTAVWHGSEVIALTQADGLTLGGAAGTIGINRSGAVTRAYDFGRAAYTLELYPAGAAADAERLLEGIITFTKSQVS